MQKKILIFIFALLIIGLWINSTRQKNVSLPEGDLFFFYSETCPHCTSERAFLSEMENKYPDIKIARFSIFNSENVELLKQFYKKYKVPEEDYGAVPATFTKDKYFVGFNEEVGREIEDYLQGVQNSIVNQPKEKIGAEDAERKIDLPFIGEIKISKFSPLVLSIVMGTLDGFNMCSLGALVLILGLVVALRSRWKIFIYGGIYILTAAIVYGVLIIFWYKLFFILSPYMQIMKYSIGFLGIGAGIYFLRQFWRFKKYGPTCDLGIGNGISNKFFSHIQEVFKKPGNILLVAASILFFAVIMTIVEFPCSALVPVAYAGILSHLNLSAFSHFFYIFVYIIFYMIDEIIVFSVAILTSAIWLASGRFVTYFTLIEAIFLILLGAYYFIGF